MTGEQPDNDKWSIELSLSRHRGNIRDCCVPMQFGNLHDIYTFLPFLSSYIRNKLQQSFDSASFHNFQTLRFSLGLARLRFGLFMMAMLLI